MNKENKVGCSTLSKAALTAVVLASMTMGVSAENLVSYTMDELVVTATRTENKIQDVPEATEVFTQEDFKALGAQDVQSALKLANNVDVGEAGMTGTKVQIRGMTSGHTLLLVNGKRMAGEDADTTVNAFELSRINLSNVERIEIVRGVSSALYGSDAMGGVINIITKQPQEEGLTVGANTGSREMNNYYHYDFGQIGKFNGSIDANFQKVRKFSWNDDATTTFYGPRQNFNFDGEYTLSEGRGIGMSLEWMKDHMRSEDFGKIPNISGNGFKVSNYDNERKGISFDYHVKTTASDFMVRAYYNQLDKDQTFFGKGKLYNFDKMKFDTFVLESRDTTTLNDLHRLTVGGEYRNLSYRGTRLGSNGNNAGNVTVSGLTKAQSEEDLNFHAAYLQDEWKPNDKLIVIPSIRYDYSDKFGSNVSPKVGMTYKIRDNLRFKANYGKGYRAPTLSELYLSMDGSFMSGIPMWVYGNPDLKPEKTLGYDFSLEGETGKAFAKVSYFHNKVDNLITTDWTNPGPGGRPVFPMIYEYRNVNSATLEGVETEIGYHINDNWTVKGTWNYLDSFNNENGSRIVGNGKNYGTVQLLYDDQKENGFSGVLWYQFMSDYYLGASSATGNGIYSYHTWNISLNKQWNEHVSTFVGVDNILDDAVPDVAVAGRLWRTGIEWNF